MNKKDLTTRVARWALLLEEYDYEIQHRRGSRMPHVDALSRYPLVMAMTEEDGVVSRIKLAQGRDDHVQAIRKILGSEDYKDYFEKHELIYKYEDEKELLVVPKAMQIEVIRKIHERGHSVAKKTEEVIKREFYINKLREKIQRCIENCIPCILGNKKEGKKEGILHPLPIQEKPLHTYYADYLGPMPSTSKKYQHIFAVIDSFTKFSWLYVTKSTTTHEAITCLKKQSDIFGNPTRVVTDRGAAFSAKEFNEYCVEESICHVMITTGVPRGNKSKD